MLEPFALLALALGIVPDTVIRVGHRLVRFRPWWFDAWGGIAAQVKGAFLAAPCGGNNHRHGEDKGEAHDVATAKIIMLARGLSAT